jgi:hypothetical protein
MQSPAINHIGLNCRNAAAQEAFFAKYFGFQRSRTFNAGKPNEYIMLKLGSVRLELFRTDLAKTEHQNLSRATQRFAKNAHRLTFSLGLFNQQQAPLLSGPGNGSESENI